jgi:hypothetical protein
MKRIAAAAAFTFLVAAAPARAESDAAPNLVGRWKLNPERSDDVAKKMQEAKDAERRGKGGLGGIGPLGPGPRGGGPMGGGPMGARPMGGRPAAGKVADQATPAELTSTPPTLVITQQAGEVTLDGGDDNLLRVRPDGRKVKRAGGAVEMKARWKDDELVLETEREEGPRVVTTYRVTSDRQELHVTSRAEGPLDEVVIRRVYDAASPE